MSFIRSSIGSVWLHHGIAAKGEVVARHGLFKGGKALCIDHRWMEVPAGAVWAPDRLRRENRAAADDDDDGDHDALGGRRLGHPALRRAKLIPTLLVRTLYVAAPEHTTVQPVARTRPTYS